MSHSEYAPAWPGTAEKELYFGRPSGPAMPPVWAHAEYFELVRSLKEKRLFDITHQTVARYIKEKHPARLASWRFNHKIRFMERGLNLRIEVLAAATVHRPADNWISVADTAAQDTGIGLYYTDLDVSH